MTQSATAERQYHHGNLRADILTRAAQIIHEQGIEALSLRGIARELGVSHAAPNRHFRNKAALLAALAAYGWAQLRAATLDDAQGIEEPRQRLNAMGRGYVRWALANPALFRCAHHPDVNRFADDELESVMHNFADTVREAVRGTQEAGRHPEVPLDILTLFTNAVPTGAAMLLTSPATAAESHLQDEEQIEEVIAQVINLVVPLE